MRSLSSQTPCSRTNRKSFDLLRGEPSQRMSRTVRPVALNQIVVWLHLRSRDDDHFDDGCNRATCRWTSDEFLHNQIRTVITLRIGGVAGGRDAHTGRKYSSVVVDECFAKDQMSGFLLFLLSKDCTSFDLPLTHSSCTNHEDTSHLLSPSPSLSSIMSWKRSKRRLNGTACTRLLDSK